MSQYKPFKMKNHNAKLLFLFILRMRKLCHMAKIDLTTCINIKTSIMNNGDLNFKFSFSFFENTQIMSCANV